VNSIDGCRCQETQEFLDRHFGKLRRSRKSHASGFKEVECQRPRHPMPQKSLIKWKRENRGAPMLRDYGHATLLGIAEQFPGSHSQVADGKHS
jgi:hypothetical protein